jgi:hypothetical protein
MPYSIEAITSRDEIEQLGTKEKFWFYDKNNIKKLFKIGRPQTGEDWSEKAAFEIGKLLGLPCAIYEFAKWDTRQGTISVSFVPEGMRLVHGNELLAIVYDKNYPRDQRYHLSDYKLSIVLNLIENELEDLKLPLEYIDDFIKKPIDLFIGYLVFDCWIANQDRHHENWAILVDTKEVKWYFAPTYDHAAGLGCKVSPEEAGERLATNDKNYSVKKFVTRAKSPFYSDTNKQLKTIEVIEILVDRYPQIVCYWIDKIEQIVVDDIRLILDKVPDDFIDDNSKKFAQQILYENKIRLLKLKKEKCNG